jgi:hypothetical protein
LSAGKTPVHDARREANPLGSAKCSAIGLSSPPIDGARDCAIRFRPHPAVSEKNLSPISPEEDEREGADPTDIRALAKKDHSDDCRSGSPNSGKSCIDRCRRQALNGFGKQIICGDGTNDYHKQRRPSG